MQLPLVSARKPQPSRMMRTSGVFLSIDKLSILNEARWPSALLGSERDCTEMVRVPNEELLNALLRVLLKLGFTEERGRRCAQLFVETKRDGIYCDRLNRFPRS